MWQQINVAFASIGQIIALPGNDDIALKLAATDHHFQTINSDIIHMVNHYKKRSTNSADDRESDEIA
jgi:hypothetical protein